MIYVGLHGLRSCFWKVRLFYCRRYVFIFRLLCCIRVFLDMLDLGILESMF